MYGQAVCGLVLMPLRILWTCRPDVPPLELSDGFSMAPGFRVDGKQVFKGGGFAQRAAISRSSRTLASGRPMFSIKVF